MNETDRLVACPRDEEQLRSGTWATIRKALKAGKQVTIVWPDGNVTPSYERKAETARGGKSARSRKKVTYGLMAHEFNLWASWQTDYVGYEVQVGPPLASFARIPKSLIVMGAGAVGVEFASARALSVFEAG